MRAGARGSLELGRSSILSGIAGRKANRLYQLPGVMEPVIAPSQATMMTTE